MIIEFNNSETILKMKSLISRIVVMNEETYIVISSIGNFIIDNFPHHSVHKSKFESWNHDELREIKTAFILVKIRDI